MRWRFIDPTNLPETAEREAVISRIDSWWRQFQARTDELRALFSAKAKWELPEWMERHLQTIDSRLMWEFGPAVRGKGHRLVITPEAAHHLRPLVRAILERAPAIDGWEFYEHRLAEDLESTQMTVEARTGCDVSDFKVRASRGEQQRIDLCYTSPAIADPDDQTALNAAFVATETLLGEQLLNDWIGAIEITPTTQGKGLKSLFRRRAPDLPHFLELDRLHETVNALIGSIRDQLPPHPHYKWVEGAEWTMWQLKPEQADDYCEQQDLFVAKSVNPLLWTAAHGGGIFSSERFSRCGETFCYVKLDGSQGLDEEGFADKSEIEDALDALLKPQDLGCHIGGGTGLRYSYIDLALTDADKGIQATRQRLQAGKVPRRSWIQFHDTDLAAEWVGVYDDSPPPPMQENEQQDCG
jgi:hypothetical protein